MRMITPWFPAGPRPPPAGGARRQGTTQRQGERGADGIRPLLANPATFAGAISMSPGIDKLRQATPPAGTRVFMGAGHMEPEFLRATLAVAQALRERGATVEETYVPGGHSMNTWINVWNRAIDALDGRPC